MTSEDLTSMAREPVRLNVYDMVGALVVSSFSFKVLFFSLSFQLLLFFGTLLLFYFEASLFIFLCV